MAVDPALSFLQTNFSLFYLNSTYLNSPACLTQSPATTCSSSTCLRRKILRQRRSRLKARRCLLLPAFLPVQDKKTKMSLGNSISLKCSYNGRSGGKIGVCCCCCLLNKRKEQSNETDRRLSAFSSVHFARLLEIVLYIQHFLSQFRLFEATPSNEQQQPPIDVAFELLEARTNGGRIQT